jgi:hypothetical protein
LRHIHTRQLKNGNFHVLIELGPTEAFPVQPVNEDAHYKLGYPVYDVVAGHVIRDASRVTWCSAQQEWVDAE